MLWAEHHQSKDSQAKRKGDTMEVIVRHFTFTSEILNGRGEGATLKAEYDVTFHRYEAQGKTYCTITPDFGPTKVLKVQDVDITWKSLFRAWQWCADHACKHLAAWTAMDLQEKDDPIPFGAERVTVIPVGELSTAALPTGHV